MSFFPNNVGILRRNLGTNLYGESAGLGPDIACECGVVRLVATSQKTTVRADSSATRGAADEIVHQSKILFTTTVFPVIGDQLSIGGFVLRCVERHPRYSVLGALDHYECDFEVWPE